MGQGSCSGVGDGDQDHAEQGWEGGFHGCPGLLLVEGGRVDDTNLTPAVLLLEPCSHRSGSPASLPGLKIPFGWGHRRFRYLVWEGRPSGRAWPDMFYGDIKHLSFDAHKGCPQEVLNALGTP